MENLKAYHNAQAYVESLPSIQGYMTKRRHPAFFLERMRILLQRLGNPEKDFHYIHVTGTSGKGSVTMLLHNMLKASGKRVGSYVSPHTTTVVERILLNGKTVSVADFVWGINKIKPAIALMRKKGNEYAPSYFEALFAVSLLIFKRRGIRWIALEVGCGGEFDATNTIPSPRVAIITNVHLDHMRLLGNTRQKIAKTKAGIIKKGTHCFTGETDPKIRKIIAAKARAQNVPMAYVPDPHTPFSLNNGRMKWKDQQLGPLTSHVLGSHQSHNIALAIAVAKFLRIPKRAIQAGVVKTRIPCRSEFMQWNPPILLDGAHNPAKMLALSKLLGCMSYTKIHAIVGVGENKPAKKLLRILSPHISDIIFTASHVELPKPASPQKLLSAWRSISNKPATILLDGQQAIDRLIARSTNNELIVITGSLYLTGELRARWISEDRILRKRTSF